MVVRVAFYPAAWLACYRWLGGTTLSEIAFAARTGKPVVLPDSWHVEDQRGEEIDAGLRVGSPSEAVQAAIEAAAG